jgi:hypothetical protein
MFCAPGIVFGGTDGVGSLFHVFHFWTYFRRYRGRRVQFSCFALPTHFRWYRGRLVLFSCFACPDSVFLFCALRLVFDGAECVRFHFHVLCSHTSFRRYRGHRVSSSFFALPNSFSTITKSDGSRFYVLGSRTRFPRYQRGGSRFIFLRARTRFRRYRGRWISFSFFTLPDSFSTVPRASGPVFMFCAPGLIFGVTEGVGSRFHVLRSRTRFWRYRERRVPFPCFSLLDIFSAVPRSSVPVFIFCAPD